MARHGPNKKIANGLVAVGSAAVLAVYAAGYTRTRSAADGFNRSEGQAAERRPGIPAPPRTSSPVAELAAPVPVTQASDKPAPSLNASARLAPASEKSSPALAVASPAPMAASVNTTAAPTAVAAPVEEAKAEPAAPAPPKVNPVAPPWNDGTYEGWGSCRHGDIQAAVVIEGGRIKSANIAQCNTRYSCDIIDELLPQVAKKQSPNVDNVSGATQSADAFYYAVYDALLKAK